VVRRRGQHRVEGAAVLEEVEEDEADRHPVDQVREEQHALEEVPEADVEAQDRREVERGDDLDHGRGQVVAADEEDLEQLFPGEDLDVVLGPDVVSSGLTPSQSVKLYATMLAIGA
jgi:hypothetical protein